MLISHCIVKPIPLIFGIGNCSAVKFKITKYKLRLTLILTDICPMSAILKNHALLINYI